MYFKGSVYSSASEILNNANNSKMILDSTGNMFGTVIVDIIALVFIWMAFMAAKKVSTAVEGALKPFEDIGNQIAGLGKKLPGMVPLPGVM